MLPSPSMTGWPSDMDLSRMNDLLPPDSLFGGRLLFSDSVDSTNTRLKELAEKGAAEGTVLLAEEQTAGRGTGGRSFSSPRGKGLYLSLLLRPEATPAQLLTLTGRAAVAVREGIGDACGLWPDIKWLNDLTVGDRKLCGILTELVGDRVVLGIGINLTQTAEDFRRDGLEHIAVSLAQAGFSVPREKLAAAVLLRLEDMYRSFPHGSEACLSRYRSCCTTVGRPISFLWNGERRTGRAVGIGEDFSLLAEDAAGQRYSVFSGTVTLL